MLALGEFKADLETFQSRLVKSETTQQYITDLQENLSKVDIRVDLSLKFNNETHLDVDIGTNDEVRGRKDQIIELEDEEQEEEVAEGADDGW